MRTAPEEPESGWKKPFAPMALALVPKNVSSSDVHGRDLPLFNPKVICRGSQFAWIFAVGDAVGDAVGAVGADDGAAVGAVEDGAAVGLCVATALRMATWR